MNWQTYLPTPEQIEADQWKVEEALEKLWAKSGHKQKTEPPKKRSKIQKTDEMFQQWASKNIGVKL